MKMKYNEFKTRICEEVKKKLPSEYADYTVMVISGDTIKSDRFTVAPPRQANKRRISPAANLYEAYRVYENTDVDFETLVDEMTEQYIEAEKATKNKIFEMITDKGTSVKDFFEAIKPQDNTIYYLTSLDDAMLKDRPYREYYGMAMVYRLVLHTDDEKQAGIEITGEVMKMLKMTESDLYEAGQKNTTRILKPQFTASADFIEKQAIYELKKHGAPQEIAEAMAAMRKKEWQFGMKEDFYIITSKWGNDGAMFGLDKNVLADIADQINDDLIVIFPTKDEAIASRATGNDAEGLKSICDSGYREILSKYKDANNMRCTDSVFYYNRTDKEITVIA